MKTFLFQSLLWNCLFVHKLSLCTPIVISPRSKLFFCTASLFLTTYLTFYQINCHLELQLYFLLNLCTSFKCLLLKVHVSFIFSHKWQRGIFPPHGLVLHTSSKSGHCDLTKCAFKFLLTLNPIIGASGNTFLCPSLDARITCNSSKIFLTSQNTGWYVILNVILFFFSWLLTFSEYASLGIALARSISLRTFPYLRSLRISLRT